MSSQHVRFTTLPLPSTIPLDSSVPPVFPPDQEGGVEGEDEDEAGRSSIFSLPPTSSPTKTINNSEIPQPPTSCSTSCIPAIERLDIWPEAEEEV